MTALDERPDHLGQLTPEMNDALTEFLLSVGDPADNHWRLSAACSVATAPLFEPCTHTELKKAGMVPDRVERIAAAKIICDGCPVRIECRQSLAADLYYAHQGVYGGEYVDRREAEKRQKAARRADGYESGGRLPRHENRWKG